MAHFRATIQGQRGDASRLGSKRSGISARVGSWEGGVRVEMQYDEQTGHNTVRVTLMPWENGQGTHRVLYDGRVDGEPDATVVRAVRSLA